MNTELFHHALEVAFDSFAMKQEDNFAVAIRVAQSAIEDHSRLCWLLDYTLRQYPAPEVPQLLSFICDSVKRKESQLTPIN